MADQNAAEEASSCPFSKAYQRYRIDLSSPPKKKEKPKFNLFKNLLSGSQNSKSRIEKQLRSDEELIWADNVTTGISALSILWQQASSILEDYEKESIVLSFPNLENSNFVVQNWKEIVDWMAEQNLVDDNESSSRLQVSILDDDNDESSSVGTVRLSRVGSARNKSYTENDDPSITAIINDRTKAWVKRLLVEQAICPFTKSDTRSGQGLKDLGVPSGTIAYHTSSVAPKANGIYKLQADLWKTMEAMMAAGPGGKTGVSSILLAAPAFDDDFELFGGPLFSTFEAGVVAARAEAQLGVVCFHPRYKVSDGSGWPGFGHMHSVPRLEKWYQEELERREKQKRRKQRNRSSQQVSTSTGSDDEKCPLLSKEDVAAGGAWQRRTPHATINVLRADQLAVAESRRNSASMYSENMERLVLEIGSERLAQDLEAERSMGR